MVLSCSGAGLCWLFKIGSFEFHFCGSADDVMVVCFSYDIVNKYISPLALRVNVFVSCGGKNHGNL